MIRLIQRTILLLLVSSPLMAATRTWTGTVSDRWSNPANWGGVIPVAGDDLLFPSLPNGPATSTNDLASGTMFHSITVNGPSYRIGGNGIVLGAGGLVLNVPFLVSLIHCELRFSSITLGDSQTWGGQGSEYTHVGPTNINGKTLTITDALNVDFDAISGMGALVKEGPNGLVRSESSTYLGTVTVNAGPLSVAGTAGDLEVNGAGAGGDEQVNDANASLELGSAHVGKVTVNGSGALTLHGNSGTSYAAGSLAFMPAAGDPAWFVLADGSLPVTFNVAGKVVLGNALLVVRSGQSAPFTLIHNQGVDPITGSFLGLPEGAIFGNGSFSRISYAGGGGGHDVTLTPVSMTVSGTTTTITSSANPSSPGQFITFTAAVTSAPTTPAGEVSFYDGGILLGSSALNASGRAAWTASLAAGSHLVTAAYLGSDTVATSQGTVRQAACEPPTMTQQPASQSIFPGQTVTLAVQAGPTPPFSFQWYRGVSGDVSSPIGASNSQTLTPFAPTTRVSFWVQVSNPCGSVQSATATITVRQPRRRTVGH
jgi:hypothetical protein